MAPTAFAQQKPKPKPAAAATGDKPLDKKQLAEAKQHYTDGDTKFKAGDFDGALKDFQAADGIKATPQTARYIGACLDSLGRFQEALDAYQRFLSNVPPKMAMRGTQIKLRVAAIQALPGKLHVTSSPSEVGFSLDGKPQPKPTPADVEVPPGHHTLHFTAPGHDPVDKDVDVDVRVETGARRDAPRERRASAAPPPRRRGRDAPSAGRAGSRRRARRGPRSAQRTRQHGLPAARPSSPWGSAPCSA